MSRPYLSVVIVGLLIAGLVGIRTVSSKSAQSSVPGLYGVYPGNGGTQAAESFATFEGAPVRWITAYLTGGSGWTPVDNPLSSSLSLWDHSQYKVVWSVPIINEPGETLAQGAAGDFNPYFLKMGDAFMAAKQSSAIFRLGWEFGGSYMPWSAGGDPTAFAEYWRQIVTTLRTIPGQHFQFDWNGGGGSDWDVADAYPGNDYVDYVTGDVFDQSWDPATGYGHNTATTAGYQVAWNDWLGNLNWMASFASQHGKALGFPEWGEATRPDGHGGGDDPYFISQMFGWMSTHNIAYEMYFNFDASDGQHDLQDGQFPAAAAEFQKLFSST